MKKAFKNSSFQTRKRKLRQHCSRFLCIFRKGHLFLSAVKATTKRSTLSKKDDTGKTYVQVGEHRKGHLDISVVELRKPCISYTQNRLVLVSCQERRVGKFFSQSNSVAENTKSTKSCKTLSDCHVTCLLQTVQCFRSSGKEKRKFSVDAAIVKFLTGSHASFYFCLNSIPGELKLPTWINQICVAFPLY